MKLVLKPVQPRQGVDWVLQSWKLFGRAPLALTGLFGTFLFVALIAMFLPLVGGLLVVSALPLLSLVMMMGSAAALRGQLVPPSLLITPLKAEALRRNRLLGLCGLYAGCTLLVLLISDGLDGGKFNELQRLMATGLETEAQREDARALLEDPALRTAVGLRLVLTGLVSIPFWYAPALVWWGAQGVAQSLFSSVLALWRSKLAFVLYLLTWFSLIAVGGAALGLLLQAAGAGQVLGLLAMPLGLTISVVFYVSLYFMFVQTFGATREDGDGADAPPLNPPE